MRLTEALNNLAYASFENFDVTRVTKKKEWSVIKDAFNTCLGAGSSPITLFNFRHLAPDVYKSLASFIIRNSMNYAVMPNDILFISPAFIENTGITNFTPPYRISLKFLDGSILYLRDGMSLDLNYDLLNRFILAQLPATSANCYEISISSPGGGVSTAINCVPLRQLDSIASFICYSALADFSSASFITISNSLSVAP